MTLGGFAFAGPASAAPSTPVQTPVEGNPSCADIAPPGVTWTEFKIEPPTAGNHTDGTLTVFITLNATAQGQTFDWTSNLGVDAVIAKGGPSANVYTYNPESTGASGLHAPINPNNNKYPDLSHITFCYDADGPTTTTTTPGGSTTTTPGGGRGELPRTGRHTGELAAIGAVLIAAGGAFLARSARLKRV
jgi:LPXTG-motif cell wall-anchored protein